MWHVWEWSIRKTNSVSLNWRSSCCCCFGAFVESASIELVLFFGRRFQFGWTHNHLGGGLGLQRRVTTTQSHDVCLVEIINIDRSNKGSIKKKMIFLFLRSIFFGEFYDINWIFDFVRTAFWWVQSKVFKIIKI